MSKLIYLLGVLTACAVAGPLAGQQTNTSLVLTLTECEERALKNSPTMQDAQLSLRTSQAKLQLARNSRFLPKFEFKNIWGPIPPARAIPRDNGGYVISPDTSTGLGDLRWFTEIDVDILQPIYTFGKIGSLSDAAYHGVQAGEAQLAGEREDTKLNIRTLYWGLVLANELVGVVEDASSELTKAENKIEEKLEEGSDEVSQSDLYKIQLFRYQLNKELREVRNKQILGKEALRTSIGMADDEEFSLVDEYLDPVEITFDSLGVYLDMARASRPELARLKAGIQAKRALVRLQQSDYYPQFFFGAQIKFNRAPARDDPNNPFIYNPTNFFRPGVIVGANWNLNFWQTRSKVRVAEAEFLQLAQKEEQLSEGLELEVQKTYLELLQAQQNMLDSRKALRTSENWLRSNTMTFDIGVGDVKELIDAFKANGGMQAEHLGNILKYNVAIAKLSKVSGHDLYPERR